MSVKELKVMDFVLIKHNNFLQQLFDVLTKSLNSFLYHSMRSEEIFGLARNITLAFLLRFVLKGGIVLDLLSPPTIAVSVGQLGIK